MMCSEGDAASVCVAGSCRVIEVPKVEDCLQPVINIVPLQVIGYLPLHSSLKVLCNSLQFSFRGTNLYSCTFSACDCSFWLII